MMRMIKYTDDKAVVAESEEELRDMMENISSKRNILWNEYKYKSGKSC